jgi:glycosyltransferase involved in cell wall biosynthesis
MKISLIATVKDEGAALRPLLDSLLAQTRPADEVVICDGGSIDGTLSILKEYQDRLPMSIVSAPGSNISQGRNRAIAVAAGPIIAATDGGVNLAPGWLAELARPFEEEGAPVVSGWFVPEPRTDFETAMGATVLPDLSDVDPLKFLPSSRSVAFLKTAWQAVGGYPEWLDYSEDVIFDLALRERYGPFSFAPNAVVYYRTRGSLRSFARQYYLYARGDGKANLWPKRHAIRFLTYLVGVPILGRLIWKGEWTGWLLLLLGAGVYCRRPAERLWAATHDRAPVRRASMFALIPFIRLVGDVAKMMGYPAGLLWRRRH